MRHISAALLILTLCVTTAEGQTALAEQQRIADLNQVASFYAKHYAPYEWKRDVLGFDLLRLNSWLRTIHNITDLDFQEALIAYVASLNDAHDYIAFPSTFSASLPFTVDIYDGKLLIDSINRALLPEAQFPFVVGDELTAFDGIPVASVIAALGPYSIAANQRSTDRIAALQLTGRSQQIFPHLPDLADSAAVTIRLRVTGAVTTYVIPWTKRGIPITSEGPVPSPGRQPFRDTEQVPGTSSGPGSGKPPVLFRIADVPVIDDTLPAYMKPMEPWLNASVTADRYGVLGFGAKTPIYALPAGFVQRRGGSAADFFFTGTFESNGLKLGLIRIPSMAPASAAIALQQLDSEMTYFNANTDGLIVDIMRNPGGSLSFDESMLQRFIPKAFQTMGFEIRVTSSWMFSIASSLNNARQANAPPQIIQNLQDIFDEMLRAFHEERGRTAPVSLNATGSLTLSPSPLAYTKPMVVLTDELTASAADMFAAVIQDNHRAPIFGMRTMGAGGNVVSYRATAFMESSFTMTESLMNRGRIIQTTDFPPTPYIENVGVRPDIPVDYMTTTNLLTGGAPFVQAFTTAIVHLIQTGTN